MTHLEFKSPDDGSLLTFDVISNQKEEILFNVTVKTPWFSGQAPSSTFMVLTPADLFEEMAAEWTGWKMKKTWSDLEQRVLFEATSDDTGHVCLTLVIQGQDYDSQLRVRLMFEAGQLESMANELSRLFG